MNRVLAPRLIPSLFVLFAACAPSEPGSLSPDTRSASPARTQPAADTDLDGVSDTDEQAAGTDPRDPSDAPAWHPELTEYPRTLFGAADIAELKSRLARTDSPFPTLAQRIRSSCNSVPAEYDDGDGLDQSALYYNANIARNCAFLALIEADSAAAAKARDILLGFPTDMGEPTTQLFDNTDIHLGEALSSAAQAYDLLRGANALDATSRSGIEATLLSLTGSAWRIYVEVLPIYWRWHQDNHKSKLAAGFGLIGIALNQDPDAAKYVNFAATEIDFVMHHQGSTEGGYAEGPYYLNYASETLLPFYLAYHRFAKAASYPYRVDCATRHPGSGCTEEDVWIDDFYVDPEVWKTYEWWLSMLMPDGLGPDYDDSNRVPTFTGFLQGMTGQGMYRAAWERNTSSPLYSRDCQDLTVETMTVFRPEVAAAWPTWTSAFTPGAGTGVFRSGWEPDARYLLLLAENGTARQYGHEHPDGTAVLLHAYGEYLVIDSGYGSWSEREAVSSAENHSIMLIDDEGPSDNFHMTSNGADTWLEDCTRATGFERCDARTTFNGVTQVRSVYFLDGKSFAIVDRLRPEDGRQHNYTALWHVNGGATSGGTFTQTAYGGQVSRTKAGATLAMATTLYPGNLSTTTASHAVGYAELAEHSVLTLNVATSDVAFLTVIEPRPAGASLPTAQVLTASGDVAALKTVDGSSAVLTVVTERVTATVPTSQSGLPEVVTDADFASISFVNGAYKAVHQEGATVLKVGGVSVL